LASACRTEGNSHDASGLKLRPVVDDLGVEPTHGAGFLMGGFPSLRPKLYLGRIGGPTYAVDCDKHRGITIFSVGH
jgi:hypothetical protein